MPRGPVDEDGGGARFPWPWRQAACGVDAVRPRLAAGDRAGGVNRIRFHDLRHTYASLLIMAGKHPKYIADQMGHASAAFTLDTYGHLMGRLPVQPVEWIDDLVFPEGLEAALKLHLLGAPNSATRGHPMSDAEGQLAAPDHPRTCVK
jgi:integrase-like protein